MNRKPTRLSLAVWSALGAISGIESPSVLAATRDELATAIQAWQTDPAATDRDLARAAGALLQAADDASLPDTPTWDELSDAVGEVLGGADSDAATD